MEHEREAEASQRQRGHPAGGALTPAHPPHLRRPFLGSSAHNRESPGLPSTNTASSREFSCLPVTDQFR